MLEDPKNLQVVYDMQENPASYDFTGFLAAAEGYRKDVGLEGIDVHFLPPFEGLFYSNYFPKDDWQRARLFWRVCVASCKFVKSVRGVFVHPKRTNIKGVIYPQDWVIDAPVREHGFAGYLQFNPQRCLEPSERARDWAKQFKNYVTLTLREVPYAPERNSNREEWVRAAGLIADAGLEPVFVPDTDGKPVPGYKNAVEASWDIDLRLALYERANVNLGVGNGPMTLCINSECRFVMFSSRKPEVDWVNGYLSNEPPVAEVIARHALDRQLVVA